MKRKRNSNYIQQCIKHGHEQYDQERLGRLVWMHKGRKKERDDDEDYTQNDKAINPGHKIDERNMEILRRKQEILKKYNKMSKENGPTFADDGFHRYSLLKGNNSALVKRVLLVDFAWRCCSKISQRSPSVCNFHGFRVAAGLFSRMRSGL